MPPAQEKIAALLASLVASGKERGVQLAAYVGGEPVVDASAGFADAENQKPVDGSTLFPIFSSGKGISATVIHRLVERGVLDYDRPLAALWPEFAAEGKGGITLRHVLRHSSGLSNLPGGLDHAGLCDWGTMTAALARSRPLSAPDEKIVYHAMTQGWLLGEPARRADGRPFEQLVREEIALPLGIGEEFFIGLPAAEEPRVAWLDSVEAQVPGASNAAALGTPEAVPFWIQPLHEWMNRSDSRRACIPASNGITSARALAKHYAALLPGGVDGIELLTPERVVLASRPSAPAGMPEENIGWRGGLGYSFAERGFGHPGFGGSVGFADLERGVAVGFTRNLYGANLETPEIFRALYEALGF